MGLSDVGTASDQNSAGSKTEEPREGRSHRGGKKLRNPERQATVKPKPQPAPPTDFQLLVRSSTGSILPIFGTSLFQDVPTTFAPLDSVPVTPEYVIGPGDEILLEVWGQARFRGRYTVDRAGNISLPDAGSVHVTGLPYAKLDSYIRSQLNRVYKNFDLTVSLGQLRSIQIFVLGDVARPGTFTVSSLSTLVNALFASGGPTRMGSLRSIHLKRTSGFDQEFDLYDLLIHGDRSKDIPLLPGDVIFVPPVGPQVAVAGSVNSPAIYELKNETTVDQVLTLAGGLSMTAGPGGTRIERIGAQKQRSVVNADVTMHRNEPIHPGDVLVVGTISDRFTNAVTLRGNVQNPGRYVWHHGMRIRDLIPDKAALLTRDYFRAQNQLGLSSAGDYTAESNTPQYDGEARTNEGRLRVGDASHAPDGKEERAATAAAMGTSSDVFAPKNDVVLSAADINWNYAVIERLDKDDLKTSLIPFDLARAVLQGDPANNLELQEGDVVTIFSTADIRVPAKQRTRFVRLEGEFWASGVYSVLPGETLRALVKRAGGLGTNAYLFGSEFRRESTRKLQQQRLNEYIDNLETDASASASRVAQQGAQSTRLLTVTPEQIQKLRSIRATGRIVLDLKPDSVGVDQIPDIELEDGDRLIVPSVPATVGVSGAVYNGSTFLYRRDASVDTYLQMAGGPTRSADRSREFLIRADGSILSRQYHSSFLADSFKKVKPLPGDTIIVPMRTTQKDAMRTVLDIAQVVAQFGIGVAAINVLK